MYTNALGWWKVSRRQLKNVPFSDFTNVQCLADRTPVSGTAVSRSICYITRIACEAQCVRLVGSQMLAKLEPCSCLTRAQH